MRVDGPGFFFISGVNIVTDSGPVFRCVPGASPPQCRPGPLFPIVSVVFYSLAQGRDQLGIDICFTDILETALPALVDSQYVM